MPPLIPAHSPSLRSSFPLRSVILILILILTLSPHPRPPLIMASAESVKPFRGPLKVEYCSSCGLPPEYCEFGPRFAQCRLLLEANHPDLLALALQHMKIKGGETPAQSNAEASKEEGKEEEKKSEGAEGDAAKASGSSSSSSSGGGDADDEFLAAAAPVKPAKKSSSSSGPSILLSLTSRNRRKFITTVKGFDSFGLSLKDVSKSLAKKFACSASVVKASNGEQEIAIQGDVMMDIPHYIAEEYEHIDPKSIYIVDKGGKKVRAL